MIWDVSELKNIPPFRGLSLPSERKGSIVNDVHLVVQTSGSGREVLVRRPRDRFVEIWDTHTDTQIASLEHDRNVSEACISRRGKFVATRTYLPERVYLWRVSNGACLESFKGKAYFKEKLLLTPDGQTLVYSLNGTVFCRPIGHLLMEGNAD
ncbi:hypothetical protein C8Q74DRAFT_1299729 [Fomes fomentarius]|nr:hypothetical protein C8Q74DRAFT_1299729 [Fomes fomentarius]